MAEWALVTGASKGLGRELALELAGVGTHLILTARSDELLDSLQQQIQHEHKVECVTIPGDLCCDKVLARVVDACLERELNILINNAGLVSIDLLENVAVERIEKMIALNLLVPIKLTRALIPLFKKRRSGTIVNINSTAGKKAVPDHTIYCATKHGITGFAEALKLEVKGYGIRLLNVSPGKMATELFRADGKEMDTAEFIPPREVAEVTVRLLQMSDRCSPSEFAVDRMS